MNQRIYGYIAREIQNLTNDEDLRQELWIYILEGNSFFTLKEYLIKLMKNSKMERTYGVKAVF